MLVMCSERTGLRYLAVVSMAESLGRDWSNRQGFPVQASLKSDLHSMAARRCRRQATLSWLVFRLV